MMVPNIRTVAAGVLVSAVGVVWLPKMFSGGSAGDDAADVEDVDDELEFENASLEGIEIEYDEFADDGADSDASAAQPPALSAGANQSPRIEPGAAAPLVRTDARSSADHAGEAGLDTDEVLELVRTLRGGSIDAPAFVSGPREFAEPLAAGMSGDASRSIDAAAFRDDYPLGAVLLDAERSFALLGDEVVVAGASFAGGAARLVQIERGAVLVELDGQALELVLPPFRSAAPEDAEDFEEDFVE